MKKQLFTLSRPYNRKDKQRIYSTPSCWDCEHIRVGIFPYRKCDIIPDEHIYPGQPEYERRDFGYVVAENCSYFKLAVELDASLLPIITKAEELE